jgi:hypothetical protein
VVAFGREDFAPFSGLEVSKLEGADGDSHQSQRGMSDGGSHSADLPVAALAEAEFDPEILDRFANTNWRISRRKGWLRIK